MTFMHDDDRDHYAALLRTHLANAKSLRDAAGATPASARDRISLRAWQAGRLARTHRDLLDSPRYGPAAEFFLSDLYGPKDFSERDEEVARILPMLLATLPGAAIHALALAVELDALSEELDTAMIAELRRAGALSTLDEASYANAFRRCGRQTDRLRQVALVRDVGETLDALARKPLVWTAVRLMRAPARLAGLAELHEFLETGFRAFRHMGTANEFLALITARESALFDRIFAGTPDPFEIPATS